MPSSATSACSCKNWFGAHEGASPSIIPCLLTHEIGHRFFRNSSSESRAVQVGGSSCGYRPEISPFDFWWLLHHELSRRPTGRHRDAPPCHSRQRTGRAAHAGWKG